MESVNLDMDDIFDDGRADDEFRQAPMMELDDDEGPMRQSGDDEAAEAPGGGESSVG